MQIEAGKYYKTRDGRKVGPMVRDDDKYGEPFVWVAPDDGSWSHDGDDGNAVGPLGSRAIGDIIAEWRDAEPDAIPLTAIDHLRKAAELFLQSCNDEAAYACIALVIDYEDHK